GRAAVGRLPDAAAGDAEEDVFAVARVDADGVNAGQVGAAAEPELAARLVPQGAHQLPRRAGVAGAKQASGNGAAPEDARLGVMAGFEAPDLLELPGDRLEIGRKARVLAVGLG